MDLCDADLIMIKLEFVTGTPFFNQLDLETRQYIARHAEIQAHGAKVDLYLQNTAPTGFFVMQAGRVKLYRQSEGKQQILELLLPDECFGAESLTTEATNPYSATTLTKTSCIFIPLEALNTLLEHHTDFQEKFLKLITARLKHFVTLVHDLAFRDVTSRLAMVLVLRARREGINTEDGIYIDRLLSQQEYADMVGTSREVVYRIFKKLEEDNLIKATRKDILIYQLHALETLAHVETR